MPTKRDTLSPSLKNNVDVSKNLPTASCPLPTSVLEAPNFCGACSSMT